jgi:hypothetical protein
MNLFQLSYESRLQEWYNLKLTLQEAPKLEKLKKTDAFWQQAPLVSHYLHVSDLDQWPNPWELLVENTYCTLARALGICYTLYMIGEMDFKLVEARDYLGNEDFLVIVEEKYILNYWPNTVESNEINQFTIKKTIDISGLLSRL